MKCAGRSTLSITGLVVALALCACAQSTENEAQTTSSTKAYEGGSSILWSKLEPESRETLVAILEELNDTCPTRHEDAEALHTRRATATAWAVLINPPGTHQHAAYTAFIYRPGDWAVVVSNAQEGPRSCVLSVALNERLYYFHGATHDGHFNELAKEQLRPIFADPSADHERFSAGFVLQTWGLWEAP